MTSRANAERWRIFWIELDIAGDHQVDKAITVVVAESGSSGPSRIGQVRLLRDVGESAVAVVAQQHQPLLAGEQDVRPAIIVVVSDGSAHGGTRKA